MDNRILRMGDNNPCFTTSITFSKDAMDALVYGLWGIATTKVITIVYSFKGKDKEIKKVAYPLPNKTDNIPEKIIVNDGATVFIYKDDSKIVLYRDKKDKFNLEYAFVYAYFLKTTGISKTAAHKMFNLF